MPNELILIAVFVFLYSLIQSLFGIGVLLFGTPTLLLLGHSFHETLLYLLPCSMAINFMQIAPPHWKQVSLKRRFVLFCLPSVAIGLFVVLKFGHVISIKRWIGLLMLTTALIRVSPSLRRMLGDYSRKYLNPSLILIGAVHGLTNMGGGLLSLLCGSIYVEKEKIRPNIAFGYSIMAFCQLVVLVATGHGAFGWKNLFLTTVALASYLLVGNRIYLASSDLNYQRALTVFISVFGLTLLLV